MDVESTMPLWDYGSLSRSKNFRGFFQKSYLRSLFYNDAKLEALRKQFWSCLHDAGDGLGRISVRRAVLFSSANSGCSCKAP
ncbi:hypothetical protein NC652_038506 [Populus alba x Populus x berolinensis]|nr:hypothetical protein NC652_038506 [Populus alba x Populus x berolinensis]